MFRFAILAWGCVVAMGLATTTASAAIFSDNFESTASGEGLAGHTANTGQVWNTKEAWANQDLEIHTVYGQGGTNGVGRFSPPDNWAYHTVPLGTTLNTGTITLSADMRSEFATNRSLLVSILGPGGATVDWINGALQFEGLGLTAPIGTTDVQDNGNLHIDLTINLDTNQVSVGWYDLDDPGNAATSGNVNLGTYAVTFEPDSLAVGVLAANFSRGVDNLTLVPEPASAALVGLAGLAILRRRVR